MTTESYNRPPGPPRSRHKGPDWRPRWSVTPALLTRFLLPGLAALLCLLPGESTRFTSHACRFWGLIGSGYPPDLIGDHLRDGSIQNLRNLGGSNNDGWGFASYLSRSTAPPLNGPLIRRGGPPANHPTDPDYNLAVDELAVLLPRAVLGHVRAGTSGHWGIPNPHPFQHEGMVFVHNGSLDTAALLELLTDDDPDYLITHPPDYVDDHIDSELYFLYLLKYIHQHPDLAPVEALRLAVREVALVMGTRRLNFLATRGDTLFALRYGSYDSGDPVRYYPTRSGSVLSPYWVAASQIVGSSSIGWGAIPARTLAVFVPGERPAFLPIDPEILPPHAPPVGIDLARPNPVFNQLAIPIEIAAGGSPVTLEIWDAQGRLVWKDGPTRFNIGQSLLRWDGRNRFGNAVASGLYFCRVTIGSQKREQTISIVR